MDKKNFNKKPLIIIGSLAFLMAGYFYRQNYKIIRAATTEETEPIKIDPVFDNKTPEEKRKWLLTHFENDEVLGNTKAPVVVIDYSSFNCSYCKKMRNETIAMIYNDYIKTNRIKYIHRPTVNNQTIFLSAMLKCVQGEENFKMANDFFAIDWTQVKNIENEIIKVAKNYGYTKEMVDNCIRNKENIEQIIKSQLLAQALLNTRVVPTIFINGEAFIGYKKPNTIKTTLDKLLQNYSDL